jgi:hypothetical protein
MYTLQEIQNWSLQDVENDPKKFKTIEKMYYGSATGSGQLLEMWKSGYRNFNSDRSYAIGNAQRVTSELWANLDRYGNWNNPNDANSYKNAQTQREIGLKTLDKWKQNLTNLGIDYNSVPTLVSAYNSFGSTPGGGVTSQQAAANPDFAQINPQTGNLYTSSYSSTNNNYGGINFRDGVPENQKRDMLALSQKPVSQWDENDRYNWNYITNNSPLPTSTTQYTSSQPTNNTTAPANQNSGSGYLYDAAHLNSKANNAAVNQLYNSYFGRNATQAELNNWGQGGGPDTTVRALEDFLKQERTRYGVTTPITPIPTSGGGTGTTPPSGNGTPTSTPPPSGNGTPTTNNITFRDGLTQAQKDSITALSQKPFSQWNDNDKANWTYGTNGSPFPSGGSGSGNGTPTPTPPPSGNGNGTTPPTINPADAKWVNDLYQKYFDRTATSAEIANWIQANPQALEQFLGAEQKKYGYVSTAMGADRKKRYDDAIAMIDSSNLPDEIKQMWKLVVGQYPDATDFKPQEIINTFNKIKNETVDPYFKELADVAVNDLKTSFTDLQTARTSELEAERANAGQDIRQAKAGLEKSGMTFTGKGIEELGGTSAYAQDNSSGTVATPTQTPFGGMFYEGNVNQANRLVSTSSAARYQSAQQTLGRNAENLLGSEGVKNALPGLSYTPGGVNLTGSLTTQKQGKLASTLQGIIDNWRSSQQLKTNI